MSARDRILAAREKNLNQLNKSAEDASTVLDVDDSPIVPTLVLVSEEQPEDSVATLKGPVQIEEPVAAQLDPVTLETVEVTAQPETETAAEPAKITPEKEPEPADPEKTEDLAALFSDLATPPAGYGASDYESRLNVPISKQTFERLDLINHTLVTEGSRFPLNRSLLLTKCAEAVVANPDYWWQEYLNSRATHAGIVTAPLQARVPLNIHNALRALAYSAEGRRPSTVMVGLAVEAFLRDATLKPRNRVTK